jgi:hypothetical protein
MKLPASVSQKLGHYVYLYVNPTNDAVFYVGKGKGSRALAHVDDAKNPLVAKAIREIRKAGYEPRVDILAHSLPNSEVALRVEAAAIDLLGLSELSNEVSGWRGRELGRARLDDLVAKYTKRRANITEPSILVRINQRFRFGMSEMELYDATRGIWSVSPERAEKAEYAFPVYQGVIREAYRIARWLPAGSTLSTREDRDDFAGSERWEFVGTLATESIRKKYINKYVGHLLPFGFQGPIRYLNEET